MKSSRRSGFPGRLWRDGKAGIAVAVCVGACIMLMPQAGSAAWSGDPIAVAVAPGKQCRPQIVYDGADGYYVVWQDMEDYSVRAQRFNAEGDAMWETDLLLGDGGGSGPQQESVADGKGGLLVSWYDSDDGYIHVQRINPDGSLAWDEGGVPVIDDAEPWIAADGAGGAIVMSYYYKVNKIASDGSLPWVDKDNAPTYSDYPDSTKIVSDGAGGAILLWRDYDSDVLQVQRIDSEGSFVWNGGQPVNLTSVGLPECPRIIESGDGGAIIAWYGNSSFDYMIYAQKINADGEIQWTEGGELVESSINYLYDPELASDGSGGAFITWFDSSENSVYAHYVNTSGSLVWDAPVIMSIEGEVYDVVQHPRHTIEDGLGGFITGWSTYDEQVKAQRCNAEGTVLWTSGGVVIAQGTSIYYGPKLASNGQGGAVAVWVDYQGLEADALSSIGAMAVEGTNEDVFMQGVSAEGVVGNPGYTPDKSRKHNHGACFIDIAGATAPHSAAGIPLLMAACAGVLCFVRKRSH